MEKGSLSGKLFISKVLFSLCSFLFVFHSCKDKKSIVTKAADIVEKECDCFSTAGISFNGKIKKVLKEGIGSDTVNYLYGYDSLDHQSMEDIKKIVTMIYDSSSGLGNCLRKARIKEEENLSVNELNKLTEVRRETAMKDTSCNVVVYYETGAFASAKYTIENKKPAISFPLPLPDSIPLRVVIIRHGEKPDSGLNLTCRGYNRSLALPEVIVSLFGVPKYVYVPVIRIGKSTNSVRMYQTIVPLVIQHDLIVNSKHAETDSTFLAEDILKKHGTVLVVWNSSSLPTIGRSLGIVDRELKWDPTDYDTIWVLDYIRSESGKLKPRFTITKENIDPSDECK